jgi:hypothetical protein
VEACVLADTRDHPELLAELVGRYGLDRMSARYPEMLHEGMTDQEAKDAPGNAMSRKLRTAETYVWGVIRLALRDPDGYHTFSKDARIVRAVARLQAALDGGYDAFLAEETAEEEQDRERYENNRGYIRPWSAE